MHLEAGERSEEEGADGGIQDAEQLNVGFAGDFQRGKRFRKLLKLIMSSNVS